MGLLSIKQMAIMYNKAKKTVAEYKQILHFLQPSTPGWTITMLTVSSYEKTGLEEVWEMITDI